MCGFVYIRWLGWLYIVMYLFGLFLIVLVVVNDCCGWNENDGYMRIKIDYLIKWLIFKILVIYSIKIKWCLFIGEIFYNYSWYDLSLFLNIVMRINFK